MARRKKYGWVKWLVILAIMAGGGYFGWKKWKAEKEEKGKPTFNVAKIEKGDVVQQVTASGTLNPVINVQVGSQISGLITNLYVDFNSKVKAGQLVAEIDPATYKTKLLQNEADLASANASLQLAELNAHRAEQLYKDQLISKADYDTAEVDLAQAKAQVQTREAQVNSTQVDLGRCKIVAPIDGIVIDRKVDIGQTVAASLNAPVLFQIANDLKNMQINASVAEADIGGVSVGQEVKFTVDAYPGRDFVGKVFQVRNAPVTVQNVVTYDTIIEVNNDDEKLKPGMTANVQIITAKRENTVRIPNSALRFRPPAPLPSETGTNSTGGAQQETKAGSDVPQTPAEMIAKVKEVKAKGEQLSEEIRAKMREMMKAGLITPQQLGFGGGGSGGGRGGSRSGGNRSSSSNKPMTRTVYVVASSLNSTNIILEDIHSATIKTGISDGINTEVISGLKEGDTVVTGQVLTSSGGGDAPTNPFASSRGFGRRGR